MWKKEEERQATTVSTSFKATGHTAIIGPTLSIKGEVSGDEDLIIEGAVEGTVFLKGSCVTIGKNGLMQGDVHGRVICVKGELTGDLYGGEQVIIESTGKVRGNITAPQVCLENGAKLRGTIDMDPQLDHESDEMPRKMGEKNDANYTMKGGTNEESFVTGFVDAEQ